MTVSFYHGLVAIACLFPLALMSLRGEERAVQKAPKVSFWVWLLLSVLGPFVWVLVQLSGTWQAGLGTAMWVTIAATMSVFAMLAWSVQETWRLTPLIVPYMILMGFTALLAQAAMGQASTGESPIHVDAWLMVHIIVSVVTYGLVTIAAVAAWAGFIQDRALKTKRPNFLTHKLPSVADCGALTVRLLGWGEGILGLGLLTGMAAEFKATGYFLVFDHKTVLSILAFMAIGGLLFIHHRTGLRGRQATRIVLLSYLLLTLGYLGVKVVTDIILV